MNVTALEEYGLRCAVQLASLPEGTTLSAPEIAEREGLSIEYVSKFMLLLIRSVRSGICFQDTLKSSLRE